MLQRSICASSSLVDLLQLAPSILHSYFFLPTIGGYALVFTVGLVGGLALHAALLVYYRSGTASLMGDFLSVTSDFLSYRGRGWVLIPITLALPIGYIVGLLVAPESAGKTGLASTYSTFLQTVAGAIIALLVGIALQTRSASRRTRFAIREAGVVAVVWMVLGELGAIAAMSPGLPPGLQRPAFSLMVAGAAAGSVALVFIAGWVESEGS